MILAAVHRPDLVAQVFGTAGVSVLRATAHAREIDPPFILLVPNLLAMRVDPDVYFCLAGLREPVEGLPVGG